VNKRDRRAATGGQVGKTARRTGASFGLATAFIGVVLTATAGPAYANVTSGDYTIGSPTAGVTGVTATPGSAGEGAATSFSLTFVATNSLSGPSGSWITVLPSESLSSAPWNVDLIDESTSGCFQSSTAGEIGPGTDLVSEVSIDLEASCSIAAGNTLVVEFNADAPAAAGNLYFSVTTSANSTATTSNAVTIGTSGATLSAASVAFGANTTYSLTNVPVTNLSADGTSLELTAGITQGTESIVFYNGASGYTVSYVPSGGSAVSDPVDSVSLGVAGESVTLTLANALATGDTLDNVATGTNPVSSGTTEANDISVTPGNGVPEASNSVTFGNQVTGVTVSPSSPVPNALATYVVNFRAYSAVSSGYIFISETAGPTDFATVTGVLVADTSRPWQYVASGAILGSGSADIPVLAAIDAGDSITLTFENVTNPPARTVTDFAVSTSSDGVPSDAAPYTIGSSAGAGVMVSVTPSTSGAIATYAISNLLASPAMIGGGSVLVLQAPAGTVFPSSPSDYSIEDSTTASGSGTVTASVSGGGTDDAAITVPNNIASGDHITIEVEDVINPGQASATDSITLLGNVIGTSSNGLTPFPDANLSYPNGAIVSFSGTDYVLAGGHALAVGSSANLTKLQKVDHAAIVGAPSGATPPTTAPRPGTLVSTRPVNGNPTIYVVGSDGHLHGFASAAQFVGDGYDPALVVTVTSLSGLTVGPTAGKEGTSVNALSTHADGALVTSGHAYYVFAGARAFGVSTPASLAKIKKADKAKVLSGTITSAETGASIADGVLLSASGVVYISYSGELWPFGSLKQLTTDGYGGTAAITTSGPGGLSVIYSYSGS